MDHVYKVHRVPTSDPILLAFLAGKFSSLRLSALTVSAKSFSSTFATESKFPATKWIERLQRPSINTFIALAYAPGTPDSAQTIDTGDLIGSATVIGPTEKSLYDLPESGGPEAVSDDMETKWQMTSVYSSPSHRGKGVAKLLILGALDYAEKASKGKGTRMRIMIHPDNAVVRTLYANIGFVDAGNCTLAEGYIGNGDADMLPSDQGRSQPEKYWARQGLVMVKVTQPAA